MNNGQGFSVASLVLGILGCIGVFLSYTPLCIVFLVLSIVGLVLAVKGRKLSVAADGKASGLATAGLVLSIIGIVFAGLGVLCYIACYVAVAETAGEIEDALESLY